MCGSKASWGYGRGGSSKGIGGYLQLGSAISDDRGRAGMDETQGRTASESILVRRKGYCQASSWKSRATNVRIQRSLVSRLPGTMECVRAPPPERDFDMQLRCYRCGWS